MGSRNVMSKAVCCLLLVVPSILPIRSSNTVWNSLCALGQEHCCKPVVKGWVKVLWISSTSSRNCCALCVAQSAFIYFFFQKNIWQFTTINKYSFFVNDCETSIGCLFNKCIQILFFGPPLFVLAQKENKKQKNGCSSGEGSIATSRKVFLTLGTTF